MALARPTFSRISSSVFVQTSERGFSLYMSRYRRRYDDHRSSYRRSDSGTSILAATRIPSPPKTVEKRILARPATSLQLTFRAVFPAPRPRLYPRIPVTSFNYQR